MKCIREMKKVSSLESFLFAYSLNTTLDLLVKDVPFFFALFN